MIYFVTLLFSLLLFLLFCFCFDFVKSCFFLFLFNFVRHVGHVLLFCIAFSILHCFCLFCLCVVFWWCFFLGLLLLLLLVSLFCPLFPSNLHDMLYYFSISFSARVTLEIHSLNLKAYESRSTSTYNKFLPPRTYMAVVVLPRPQLSLSIQEYFRRYTLNNMHADMSIVTLSRFPSFIPTQYSAIAGATCERWFVSSRPVARAAIDVFHSTWWCLTHARVTVQSAKFVVHRSHVETTRRGQMLSSWVTVIVPQSVTD